MIYKIGGEVGAYAMYDILDYAIQNIHEFNTIDLIRTIYTIASISTTTNGLQWIPENRAVTFQNAWVATATPQLATSRLSI